MTHQKPPNVVTKALLLLPICDNDPIAAALLDWCCERHVCKQEELQQRREQEERERQERWEAMTEEEQMDEVDKGYDEWVDRLQAYSVGEGEWYDQFFGYTEDPLDAYSVSWVEEMLPAVISQMEGYKEYSNFTRSEGPLSEEDLIEALYLLQQKDYVHVLGLKNGQLEKGFRDRITFCVHKEVLDAAAVRAQKQGDILVAPTLHKRVEGQKVARHRQMAARYALPANLTLEEWLTTLDDFGRRCAYCRKEPYEVIEHHIPLILGGGSTAWNCVPACVHCNLKKSDMHPHDVPEKYGLTKAIARVQDYLDQKKKRAVKGT